MGSIARERAGQFATEEVFNEVKLHEMTWEGCKACPLHSKRSNVVLWRGHLPAKVIFIGEAPGESEDVLGVPFVGPAGQVLDEIIAEAYGEIDPKLAKRLPFAMTNAVACKPVEDAGHTAGMTRRPKAAEVKGCSARLNAFLKISDPAIVFLVGKVAAAAQRSLEVPAVHIVHPAALLRQNDAQYALGFKRAYKTIASHLAGLHISSRKDRT